jgi:hypothetical protein
MATKASKAFASKSLRELDAAASAGFITANSHGPKKQFEVVAKFRTMEEMHAFHRAVLNCCRAVREMGEADEPSAGSSEGGGSAGPFSHGTGGGKRIVRGTNSLT